MYRQNILVAIYSKIEGLTSAVARLSEAEFDIGRVSVLGPLSQSNETSWAFLLERWYQGRPSPSSSTGSVVILGPLASNMTARRGASAGSGLSVGRVGIPGIPAASVILYEQALRCDKFVLLFELGRAEVARAKTSICATMPMRLDVYRGSAETTAIAA